MSAYSLRHIGTKRWLVFPPSKGLGVHTTYELSRAEQYPSMTEAELERLQLREFAPAYEVCCVDANA